MLEIVFYLMLLVTSTSQDNKIISIPIVTFLGRYNLKCNFGIEMGSKNLEINMDIDYLLISGNESQILAMKDSKIILNQTYLEIEGNQEKAFLCQSKITLINQNPLNMFYYLSTKYRLNDIFPLAYHYSNNAFSVIHSLYNTNEIDQLGFGFYLQRRLDEMEGFLYLGGIPNKLIEKAKAMNLTGSKEFKDLEKFVKSHNDTEEKYTEAEGQQFDTLLNALANKVL